MKTVINAILYAGQQIAISAAKSIGIVLLSIVSLTVSGGSSKYAVSEIPPELKANAKAVIRSEEQILRIKSTSDASISHFVAITILNENGIGLAIFHEQYDKFNKISNIHGTIYNAAGEKVEQLFQDHLIDHSSISGINLYDDNRVKYFEPKYRTYPFTVEYSYDTDLDGYNDFPAWLPCSDFNISVQSSTFTVIASNAALFRSYSPGNRYVPKSVTTEKDLTTFTWNLTNQPAFEEEPYSKSISDYRPVVYFAPTSFSIGGYVGDMTTWKDFGNWVKEMNFSRNRIPDEKKAFIQDLIKDCPNKYEQARKIYEYFQKSTRYVSVQIGIGGWRPLEATEVDRLGYGDCKALANYMQSLLASANINSYYTLVHAGRDASPLISEFPSQQFNHAIVCLPIDNDTIWLECTDQKIPFGYNSTFTDDRNVLLINEFEGGHLVRTPRYDSLANYRNRKYFISLNDAGDAKIRLHTDYSGLYFDERFAYLTVDAERLKKLIYSNFITAGLSLDSFNLGVIPKKIPVVGENIACSVSGYSTITGNRMLVQFNRLFAPPELPKKIIQRKSPVFIRRDFIQNDTVTMEIPDGYSVESIPESSVVSSRFGYCMYNLTMQGEHSIRFTRHMAVKSGTYPAEYYNELRKFIADVTFNDGMKMCLKRKV